MTQKRYECVCFNKIIQCLQAKQEKCSPVSKEMLTNGKKKDLSQPPSLLVARAGNKFGMTLYRKLRKTGNLVFSPFSLTSALAMLLPGAKGLTLSQVATTCICSCDDFIPDEKGPLFAPNEGYLDRLQVSSKLFQYLAKNFKLEQVSWFRCLLPQLKTNNNFTLDTANKIFLKKDIHPGKKY